MSKKRLIAEGFFDELEEELGAPIESIEITTREEVTMWLCDWCEKEYETEKGALIHMKRFCKEKPILEVTPSEDHELWPDHKLEEDWEEI